MLPAPPMSWEPGETGGVSPSGGSHAGPRVWLGRRHPTLVGTMGRKRTRLHPHTPAARGRPPSRRPVFSADGCASSAARHQGEWVWGFPPVSLPAALPAWRWSQQHPATGRLGTAGGGFAAGQSPRGRAEMLLQLPALRAEGQSLGCSGAFRPSQQNLLLLCILQQPKGWGTRPCVLRLPCQSRVRSHRKPPGQGTRLLALSQHSALKQQAPSTAPAPTINPPCTPIHPQHYPMPRGVPEPPGWGTKAFCPFPASSGSAHSPPAETALAF